MCFRKQTKINKPFQSLRRKRKYVLDKSFGSSIVRNWYVRGRKHLRQKAIQAKCVKNNTFLCISPIELSCNENSQRVGFIWQTVNTTSTSEIENKLFSKRKKEL